MEVQVSPDRHKILDHTHISWSNFPRGVFFITQMSGVKKFSWRVSSFHHLLSAENSSPSFLTLEIPWDIRYSRSTQICLVVPSQILFTKPISSALLLFRIASQVVRTIELRSHINKNSLLEVQCAANWCAKKTRAPCNNKPVNCSPIECFATKSALLF